MCNCLFLPYNGFIYQGVNPHARMHKCMARMHIRTYAHARTHDARKAKTSTSQHDARRAKTSVHAMIFCHIHICDMSNLLSCVGAPRSVSNNTPIYIYICACIYTPISTYAYSHVRIYTQVHTYEHAHLCIDTSTCSANANGPDFLALISTNQTVRQRQGLSRV